MREIELLAPAKDLQTGIEAIRHGADAVYIGAPRFGARAAAGNSVEDIRQLVDFAQPYGVKVYVTLNTILFDNELEEARQLADELQAAGVDALIVQDFGLITNYEIRNTNAQPRNTDFGFHKLRLHASTQMDNRTAEKVEWLRGLGFRQVVLARELTLEEISEIHRRVPDVRLEVFVHGAICVSYNGQCYASQYCFGRSANRGQCAQFCRMPFDLIEGEGEKERVLMRQKHLLSLRDMNRSAQLEALLDAGASSLKIEGRLKDTGYVKNVVAYYRQRLDEIFSRRPEYRRSSLGYEKITFSPDLTKSFNRLFTNYFLDGRTRDMANTHTPKSMGEPITPETELHNGDGLCFINKEGQLEGFRVNNASKVVIRKGMFRNHDQQFEQQLSKPTATRKVRVRWLLKEEEDGFLLRLIREDGATAEQVFPHPHELARSPQTEQIERQLARLGDTPYESTGTDIEMSQNWFIPGSTLADWRRKTLQALQLSTTSQAERELNAQSVKPDHEPTPLSGGEGQGGESLTYLANVANHEARRFYLEQGAKQVDWAMEVEQPQQQEKELLLMTCRYCIRHELGMCYKELRMKDNSPLFLRLADGRRFRLGFDCKNCQMKVYAEK